ncbi:MAG: hypothetical protein IT379_16560 [Deltaproteobacteria bacterium]|nr:hypothetical protein [Deltaproteobacteria bacterium]
MRALPSILVLASFGAAASVSSSVAAHGGPPAVRRVAFHPVEPDTLYAQATFGLLVSRDHGETWTLTCEEAIGWQPTENPHIAGTTDGAVVFGLISGLRRSEMALCGAGLPRADLEDVRIIALARDATDDRRHFAVTALNADPNTVYVSPDDGITWEPSGDRLVAGDVPSSLLVAPNDAQTVYVSGSRLDPAFGFVARSDDGGGTWTTYEVALEDAITFSLGAVDPRDARRVLAYRTSFDVADVLLLSEDGGETWDEVASVSGDVTAVAFAPDGSRAWYGSYEKGLHVSDDGGRTFAPQILDLAIQCLAAREGELWVCADNYADGFALGVSTDGGDTFEPRFRYEELAGQVACAEGTRSAEVCPVAWRAISDIFGLDAGAGADDAGAGRPDATARDAGADAGRDGDASAAMDTSVGPDTSTRSADDGGDDDGCGCSVPGRSHGTPRASWLGVALVLGLAVGARRSRRSRQSRARS